MNKQRILAILDDLDTIMIKHLGKNNKFLNVTDNSVKDSLFALEQMENDALQTDIPELIKNRIYITKSAFKAAMDPKQTDVDDFVNYYFKYIHDIRKINNQGIKSKREWFKYIGDSIYSYHEPDKRLKDYLKEHNKEMTVGDQIRYNQMFLSRIQQLSDANEIDQDIKIYNSNRASSTERSLTVQKEKEETLFYRIITKIKKWFISRTFEQQEEINQERKVDPLVEYENLRDRIYVDAEREQIVIGDLHGDIKKWERVEEYLKKHPTAKVYILGDATDRGPDGLKILRRIMELNLEGRAEYIPGNHDINVYRYLRFDKNLMFCSMISRDLSQGEVDILKKLYSRQSIDQIDKSILRSLICNPKLSNSEKVYLASYVEMARNQGYITMQELDNFIRNEVTQRHDKKFGVKHYTLPDELKDWLGGLPIQREITVGNQKYLLAHAVPIFGGDNNYTIEKATNDEINGRINNIDFKRFFTTMWYREEDPELTQSVGMNPDFPEGYIGVVGHNPHDTITQSFVAGNPNKIMFCIDSSNTDKLPMYNLTTNKRYNDLRPNQEKQENTQKHLQIH